MRVGAAHLVALSLGGLAVGEGGQKLFHDLELSSEEGILGHVDLRGNGFQMFTYFDLPFSFLIPCGLANYKIWWLVILTRIISNRFDTK